MARTKSWVIEETSFPKKKDMEEQLKFLIRYATLAPNTHNIQSWNFRVKKNNIYISIDKKRKLPIAEKKDSY